MPKQHYKPGATVPKSGQAIIVDANGKPIGVERTVVEGKIFPPTKAKGQTYEMVDLAKHEKK
jgi:hypothetical protein